MLKFQLLDDQDVQQAFAAHLRALREQAKLSREALAQRSCVPAPTIKKFELTGQISFRQPLLLWQTLDDLSRLYELTQNRRQPDRMPAGGARPKAQVYAQPGDLSRCSTLAKPGDEAWLVKFSSSNLPLGHEEVICEAIFLSLAKRAQLEPPEWSLVPAAQGSGADVWLAIKRFDWLHNATAAAGRVHMHSACGLLDADFRMQSLDYEDLIKASRHLCKSPAVGRLQFRRALFNLFACNQDDHSKNWAFLQADNGEWSAAPFYDVTFSPHPFGEHATAFAGYGKAPTVKAVQALAQRAGFASWNDAQECIVELLGVLSGFEVVVREHGLSRSTTRLISEHLQRVREANMHLLSS